MRREYNEAVGAMYNAYRAMITRLRKAYPEFDLLESDTRTRKFIAAL